MFEGSESTENLYFTSLVETGRAVENNNSLSFTWNGKSENISHEHKNNDDMKRKATRCD